MQLELNYGKQVFRALELIEVANRFEYGISCVNIIIDRCKTINLCALHYKR